MTGTEVVAEARKLLGVKWRHQGRRRDAVDCIGLVVVVRRALGLSTLDVTDYPMKARDESMLAYCREHMRGLSPDELQAGDIAVFGFDPDRHMAIVGDYPGGGLSMIHAYLLNRRVVENRMDETYWRPRLRGCFRFPEIDA